MAYEEGEFHDLFMTIIYLVVSVYMCMYYNYTVVVNVATASQSKRGGEICRLCNSICR